MTGLRPSLRWRLTLFYGALLAIVLLIVGVAVFAALRGSVHQTLDESLQDAARLAASQLAGDEGKVQLLEAANDRLQAQLPSATSFVIYDAAGRVTDRVGAARVNLPLSAGYATVGELRVYTERLASGGWVRAIRGGAETLEVLSRVEGFLLIALPLLLFLGLVGGYLIADRALEPVDRVSRLAASIAQSGHYEARVPEAGGRDEMARLTRTVNAMLERLESTIQRERAFALAAAHELRTPLSALRGRASLTLKRRRSPEEYERATSELLETSEEMSALVERLLTLARTNQTPERNLFDLGDVALSAAEALEGGVRERGAHLHLESGSAPMRGDPQALRVVIGNLLENAIRYGHAGGNVWLKTGSGEITVWLTVTDDGDGIAESDLERLRQPFQRGLGMQGIAGTGLGLALVAAVVEQYGGRLELGRAPEGGLLARVEFQKAD